MLVLAEVAELAAPKLNLKTKAKQIIHLLNNERQAAILANTLLGAVKSSYDRKSIFVRQVFRKENIIYC